ncbi:MAG: hypothetical protein A2270_08545 [Elusimicrobia bacterium RIFOXYA12_FULL_51_18]|nr:MAG: hypothetical protein A2270_08545 [Elusimicrobia bacterium RIFOXYA12_FULL_51_18]OGS28672.1 MAG: hypothetical protein A2218_09860 [Elusimicrobia bacterium RIFOXYA2_FULL_53_38]
MPPGFPRAPGPGFMEKKTGAFRRLRNATARIAVRFERSSPSLMIAMRSSPRSQNPPNGARRKPAVTLHCSLILIFKM